MSVKWIGWVGIFHVLFIVGWIAYHLSHQLVHPPPMLEEGQSLAELGMLYYSEHRGLLGFDHGSKSLLMLLSIVIPVGIFYLVKKGSAFDLLNLLALIAGVVGFTLYSLSLMLQAVTVEYAFQLFVNNNDASAQAFATLIYDWTMLQGGFSVSIYILANLALAAWILIHSIKVARDFKMRAFRVFGVTVGLLHIGGYSVAWFFLMQGSQVMHDVNEVVGILWLVWLAWVSFYIINGKINRSEIN